MGFFLNEQQAATLVARPKPKPRNGKTTNIENTPRGCEFCPLQDTWKNISTPQMPVVGAWNIGDGRNRSDLSIENCDILILGEGPGEQEDIKGVPWVGDAGKFLRKHIPMRLTEQIALSNNVRCRPPGNRTPTGLEGHCCSIHLEEDIEKHNFKVILGLGGSPLSRFITEAPITHIHGTRFPVRIGDKILWYYPTFHPSYLLHNGGERSLQFPVFAEDLRRFFREYEKWKKPHIEDIKPEDVICVYNKDEAFALYEKLKGGVIGVDIETHSDYYQTHKNNKLIARCAELGSRILSASFSDGDLTFAFPINHPAHINDWGLELLLLATSEHNWVGHNSAFELVWLLWHAKKAGIEWSPARFDDSMALCRLYHSRETLLNLGICSRIHLGVNIKKLTKVDPSNILASTLDDILPYNGLDSWASLKILKVLQNKVNKDNYEHLLGSITSTAYMEFLGLPINLDVAHELKKEWGDLAIAKEEEAKTYYEVKAFERELQQEWNIGSTKDVATALVNYGKLDLPKSGKGNYVTDDEALSPFVETNPIARITLDYREAKKHESTYIDPILAIPERFEDGLAHPAYSTMLTATFRTSSNDFNAQNFPKRKHRKLRSQIVAPPGEIFASCDSGQLEARIYGMDSKDTNLCESIIRVQKHPEEDIHLYWLKRLLALYPPYMDRLRQKVNQAEEAKIIKYGRDIIKTDFTFATFFGTTAKNCAERTDVPFPIMQELLGEFWDRYPQAAKYLKARAQEYRNTGGVTALTGITRYGVFGGMEYINTPIQHTGAYLVLQAQNELSQLALETGDMYLHPRINIHDDLTFLLPDQEDRIEEYISIIAKAMTRVRFPWQIVPLSVEVKIGYNWADQEEIAVITGDYVR